jgi:hypothetical protein
LLSGWQELLFCFLVKTLSFLHLNKLVKIRRFGFAQRPDFLYPERSRGHKFLLPERSRRAQKFSTLFPENPALRLRAATGFSLP